MRSPIGGSDNSGGKMKGKKPEKLKWKAEMANLEKLKSERMKTSTEKSVKLQPIMKKKPLYPFVLASYNHLLVVNVKALCCGWFRRGQDGDKERLTDYVKE